MLEFPWLWVPSVVVVVASRISIALPVLRRSILLGHVAGAVWIECIDSESLVVTVFAGANAAASKFLLRRAH